MLDVAADPGHFRDAGNGFQRGAEHGFLQTPELERRFQRRVRDQRVLEYPARARRGRPHLHAHVGRQLPFRIAHPFHDGLAAALQVGARLEHDVDVRHARHRRTTHCGRARHTVEGFGEHTGDLGRDLARRMAHPVGDQHDLRVREVRDGVARERTPRHLADERQHDRQSDHDPVMTRTPADDTTDHGFTSPVSPRCCRRRSASSANVLPTITRSSADRPDSTVA